MQLYVLLLDRTTLSRKNGWQDDKGRIYEELQHLEAPRTPGFMTGCFSCVPLFALEVKTAVQPSLSRGTIKLRNSGLAVGILEIYAKQNSFSNLKWYTDDGYSGANFQRLGFQAMLASKNAEKFMKIVRKNMNFEELPPILLREFVEKIVIHEMVAP